MDLSSGDALFAAGLLSAGAGAVLLGGWPAGLLLVGLVVMVFALLRAAASPRHPRKG